MIKLVPRSTHSTMWIWLTPVMAFALSIVTGGLLFYLLGYPPVDTLSAFFVQPLMDRYGMAELIVKAAPMAMIAVGLSLGFRANVWNIGAEGQLTIGAALGSLLVIYNPDSESIVLLPAILIMGMLGGMAWAAIPAYLKTRFNTNEILTSLMLVYVAILLLSTLVHGPWKDPMGFNFPESIDFPDVASIPKILSGTRMHAGVFAALLAVAAGWVVLSKTLIGFQVRVVGLAPQAAKYSGVDASKIVWLTMLGTGALAGLAGIIEVSGLIGRLQPVISPGYGFTAIIVAFVGRLHPLGVLIASLVLALSYLGADSVQIRLGLPRGIAGVFQGMLLFYLLAADVLIHYKVRIGSQRNTVGRVVE